MILDGQVAKIVADRYQGWQSAFGQDVLAGRASLDAVAARVMTSNGRF
jgi:xylose isomerase